MDKERLGIIDEIHKPARRRFLRRRVQIRGLDDSFQADLVDLKSLSRSNNGFCYILMVINCFSKFAWAEPLKTKSGAEVRNAMARILAKTTPPRNLQVDMGKEFYNAPFQELVAQHRINMYSTYSVMKASIVERLNRTIKSAIFKNFAVNGNRNWVKDLQSIVDRYNATVHRTTGMRPRDVTRKHERRLLTTVYRETKQAGRARFAVGDQVRISKYKHLFEKGYTPNWTTEVFTIERKQPTNPVTYLLLDSLGHSIKGGFYEFELQRTKHPDVYLVESVLKRRGDEEYVKWLGFDSSHNSWIKV